MLHKTLINQFQYASKFSKLNIYLILIQIHIILIAFMSGSKSDIYPNKAKHQCQSPSGKIF